MKKVAYILFVILGFLFLHSEVGLLEDCDDHHKNHDVCTILQNSDNVISISYSDYFLKIQHLPIPDFSFIILPVLFFDNFLNYSKQDYTPHRLKNNQLIHFLNSLLI